MVGIPITGSGNHEIEIKAFNAEASFIKKQVALSDGKPEIIQLELKVADMNKPYVAVVSADKNPDLRKEIVGSVINTSFLADK